MENPSRLVYMSKDEWAEVFEDLNVDQSENGGFDKKRVARMQDRAVSELEADLVERFIIPLVGEPGGKWESAPAYTQFKIKSTLISKLRELIGQGKQKNVVIDSTERFIDIKQKAYTDHVKGLLDPKKIYGLKLQEYATDGSLNPVQKVGVARPDRSRSPRANDEDILL